MEKGKCCGSKYHPKAKAVNTRPQMTKQGLLKIQINPQKGTIKTQEIDNTKTSTRQKQVVS